MHVLKTRIYKPTIDRKILTRERLVGQLSQGESYPLTLVVASAGYGKSVLVSQSLDRSNSKYCWISLQDDCNDLRIFLSYLELSLCHEFPNALVLISDMLKATVLPPRHTIYEILINELCALPEPINIVLEDYHFIKSKAIHDLIDECLKYPNQQYKFTVITRFDPPFKLATLKAKSKIQEVRSAELLFSPHEIVQLSKLCFHKDIETEEAEAIEQLSEGWVIGVRLILNQLAIGTTIQDSLKWLMDKKQGLTDYLLEEVLNQQPQIAHKYILAAALFDRFNLDLIQSLNLSNGSVPENPRIILEPIIQKATFLIPLDGENVWYRYHHLIQRFCQKRCYEEMDQSKIQSICLNAAGYFEVNYLWEEAIDYALMAKNIPKAVSIIETHYSLLLDSDQFARLEGWLNKLPSGTIEKYLVLLLIRAFLADLTKNFKSMGVDLESAHKMISRLDKSKPVSSRIMAEFYAIKSCYIFYTGRIDESINLARKAIEAFQNASCYMRDFALCYLSMGLTLSGDAQLAIDATNSVLNSGNSLSDEEIMRLEVVKVISFAMSGDIGKLIRPASLVLRISQSKKSWITNSMANYYLAATHYMQNNPSEVEFLFQNVKAHRFSGRPFWVIHMYFFEIKRLLINGQFVELSQLLDELYMYSKSFESSSYNSLVVTFDLEIALALGNTQKVIQLVTDVDFNSVFLPVYFYTPQLTRIKLGLQYPTFFPANETKFIIDNFIKKCNSLHCYHFLIQAYPLLCDWHLKFGNKESAVSALVKAIDYGRHNKFVRPLLESDQPVLDLIKEHYANQLDDPFIASIFEYINCIKLSGGIKANLITLTHSPIKDQFGLNENEVKILELCAKGLRIKEIANQLCLSAGTIKTYLYNIYKKMSVSNRAGALTKLKEANSIHSLS